MVMARKETGLMVIYFMFIDIYANEEEVRYLLYYCSILMISNPCYPCFLLGEERE